MLCIKRIVLPFPENSGSQGLGRSRKVDRCVIGDSPHIRSGSLLNPSPVIPLKFLAECGVVDIFHYILHSHTQNITILVTGKNADKNLE